MDKISLILHFYRISNIFYRPHDRNSSALVLVKLFMYVTMAEYHYLCINMVKNVMAQLFNMLSLTQAILFDLLLLRDTCTLLQRWRSSDCRWLTVVAMVTRAGSASFPGIRTAAGTGPGGSAFPSRLDTTSPLGMIRYDVAARRAIGCFFLHKPTRDERTLIRGF